LIGAVEQRTRARRIGGRRVEQRGLSRNRCGDVFQCRCDGVDFSTDRSFDAGECLIVVVGTEPCALE
jgi:hypothetical protein